MSAQNLLSIVTIVRNDLQALRKTLSSIPLSNSITSIVIDGSDNYQHQKGFCDEYSKTSNLTINYQEQCGRGLYAAMNQGLKLVNSEWVIFMCAGDYFNDNSTYIIDLINEASKCKVDSIICRAKIISAQGNKIGLKPPHSKVPRYLYKALSYWIPWLYSPCHQSMFFRTDIHSSIFYEEDGVVGSDQVIMHKFLERPFYLSEYILSVNDTCGVSSNAPPSTSSLLYYLRSSFKLRQSRRVIFTTLKYIFMVLGFKDFDGIRNFRHKIIAPVIVFIIKSYLHLLNYLKNIF